MKQLNLFTKSQPSDLEILDNMVSYQEPDGVSSDIDWEIKWCVEAGEDQRAHELLTIKYDMGN